MNSIPRVLFLNPWDRVIGPNRYLVEMLRQEPDLAARASVVLHEGNDASREYEELGCAVLVCPESAQIRARLSLGNMRAFAVNHTVGLLRMIRRTRAEKPDVIVSNTEQLLLGDMLSRFTGVPHIKIFHAITFAYRLKSHPRAERAYLGLLTAGSRKVIAVSETLKHALLSGGVRPGKVVTVPNPIPVGRLYGSSGAPLPDGLDGRLAGRTPVLLNVGRISPMKGQDQLVKALPAIKKRYPALLCVFAGLVGADSGMEHTHRYFSEMRAFIAAEGLEENVLMLGQIEYLPALFRRADLCVHTSWTESFGRGPAEALACLTPVVAYDSDAIPEVVGPGGVCVKAGDIAGLAAAVIDLMEDGSRRSRLADEGRRHIVERFEAKSAAALFRRVLADEAIRRSGKESGSCAA